jgi:hypothetical protein
MKTREQYAAMAERLIAESDTIPRPNDESHCEADRAIAEAQVFATLATVAPAEPLPVPQPEPYIPVALSIRLRELHRDNNNACTTCVEEDGTPMCWPCGTFTALDDAESQLSPDEYDGLTNADVLTTSELHGLDQADELALDAAAEKAGDTR